MRCWIVTWYDAIMRQAKTANIFQIWVWFGPRWSICTTLQPQLETPLDLEWSGGPNHPRFSSRLKMCCLDLPFWVARTWGWVRPSSASHLSLCGSGYTKHPHRTGMEKETSKATHVLGAIQRLPQGSRTGFRGWLISLNCNIMVP